MAIKEETIAIVKNKAIDMLRNDNNLNLFNSVKSEKTKLDNEISKIDEDFSKMTDMLEKMSNSLISKFQKEVDLVNSKIDEVRNGVIENINDGSVRIRGKNTLRAPNGNLYKTIDNSSRQGTKSFELTFPDGNKMDLEYSESF